MTLLTLQVSKMCQPLGDLQHVASANSTDDFVLAYTSLLQVMPVSSPAEPYLGFFWQTILWSVTHWCQPLGPCRFIAIHHLALVSHHWFSQKYFTIRTYATVPDCIIITIIAMQ